MTKTKLGKELEFISRVKRDGSGTDEVTNKDVEIMQSEQFKLTRLSITQDTWIASSFDTYVVRLKQPN